MRPSSYHLSEMTEYIESFSSEVNDSAVRGAFPEITDSERPMWTSGPSMLSMADKYLLALVVLIIHLAFFVGEWKDAVSYTHLTLPTKRIV